MASKQEVRAAKAAEALRELQRREQRRHRLTILAVVAAVVLVVGGGFVINQLRSEKDAVDAPAAGAGATSTGADAGSAAAAGSDYGVTIGDPDAPHAIVIYEDFVCPFCGQLESASHERLAELADDGKVYVEYRPFDLLQTDYSVDAANAFRVALEAAGPEVAKQLHDVLYAQQPAESGPFPDADWYVERAVEAGATEDDVRPGIEGAAEVDWVQDATAAASAAGVSSTPTILLDGKDFSRGATPDDIAANLIAEVE